jgi:neutral ceramidase
MLRRATPGNLVLVGHDRRVARRTGSEVLGPFLDGARRARFGVRTGAPAPLPAVAGLLAGAAEVDLTPPPGLPKAGYSRNANTGDGFRTRLRARVVHLRAGSSSLAIVQCDLLGGSAVVQHLVAEAVAEQTDVPLAGLFLGATHTHAGPGQFLGTDFYNRFASNKPGFDPAWAQFLVTQISAGVQEAVASRRPARLAVGQAEVWGFTRNRSQPPHVRNPDVADRRDEPQRTYVNVNPWLHLLRVDAEPEGGGGPFRPLAAAVVFSVHGTGVSQRAAEYNADVWAYLVGSMADRIEADHGVRPVVGAMEGTHADVAPALRPGQAGHLEARRVGVGVGEQAAALFTRIGPDLRDDLQLGCGLREVDLDEDRSAGGVTLPRRAAVGAALVAGAHENHTPVLHRLPAFRLGWPKPFRSRDPQGPKWVLGSRWIQPLVIRPRSFPRVLPVQVLRIGDALLVGLPFEITVESGRRIEAAARAATAADGIERAIVSSVANEYSGYCTTPEEYALQHYEGGHTIYGPNTQPFLAVHTARLAGEVVQQGLVHAALPDRRFDLAVHRYLPAPTGVPVDRASLGAAVFADATASADACWEWRWRDVAPGDLHWHLPLVRVEVAHDDGGPGRSVADDQGWDVEVAHIGADRSLDGAGHVYAARWWAPAFRLGTQHRFVLEPNAGQPDLASPPFD